MAFPQVASGTTTANSAGNVTSTTLTYPANVASGDLLLALVSIDGAGDTVTLSNFTELTNARHSVLTDNGAGYWFYRVASGAHSGTETATVSSSEWITGAMIRIPAASWHGTVSGGVEASAAGNPAGSDTTIEIPSLTPSWGSADTLWIAAGTWDGTPTYVSSPTNYTPLVDVDPANSNGASLAIATRENATATESPDAFTISALEQWAGYLVAVRPAAGGTPDPVTGTGAITAPAATVAGTGAETFTATGAVSVPAPTVAGTGAETFTATGAVTVPAGTVAGSGEHTEPAGDPPTGTGSITAAAATVSGTGSLILTATGAVSVPAGTVAGSGVESFTATGAISAPAATVSGSGTETLTGTGAISVPAGTVSGTGSTATNVTGTGAISASAPTVSGTGSAGGIEGTATATVDLTHTATASIAGGTATATVVLLHTATATVS